MAGTPEALLLSDSSVLINFLRIDRTDLLIAVATRRLVTDVVRQEIRVRYQSDRLEAAITRGEFEEVTLTDLADFQAAAKLQAAGLGAGESFSIVAAQKLGAALAIDDRKATGHAERAYPALRCLTTQDLMLKNIRMGTLHVAEADAIKEDWHLHHRFTLRIASFAELLP
jgi:predicted nucleic acid-binding protein